MTRSCRSNRRPTWLAALAAVVLLALPAVAGPAGRNVVLAQAKPVGLPAASSTVGMIRRGPDGRIEAVDPTKLAGKAGRGPCSADAICVGPGLAFATLGAAAAAARPGDVIEVVAGTYRESVWLKAPRLTVRGIGGRPHFDCSGLKIADNKGCLLLGAPDITLDNLEISGAEISKGLGGNGACVRNEPNLSFTLRRIVCHNSQDGLLTDGGSVVIDHSEFYDTGWNFSSHEHWGHNIYLAGACPRVVFRDSYTHDSREGHEFKSRCRETIIENSTFHAVRGSRAIDIPDGGTVTIDGGTIIQEPGVQNPEMIGYAAESCKYPGNMTIRNMHFVGNNPRGVIANYGKCPGAVISLVNPTFVGHRPSFRGEVVVR